MQLLPTFLKVADIFVQYWNTFLSIHVSASLLIFGVTWTFRSLREYILARRGETLPHVMNILLGVIEVSLVYAIRGIAHGCSIRAVGELNAGRKSGITAIDCIRAIRQKIFSLVSAYWLVALTAFVPYALLCAFMHYVSMKSHLAVGLVVVGIPTLIFVSAVAILAFSTLAVIVVESLGPIDAIKRSQDLSTRYLKRIATVVVAFGAGYYLWVLLVRVILCIFTGFYTRFQYYMHSSFFDDIASLNGAIGPTPTYWFLLPLAGAVGSILQATVYLDLRSAEGLDASKLAEELGIVNEILDYVDIEKKDVYVDMENKEADAAKGAMA